MRESNKRPETEAEPRGNGKPISLAPLSFDEAVECMLQVKPEPKGEPKTAKKPATKKKR